MGYIELKTGQVALRPSVSPPDWQTMTMPTKLADNIVFGNGKFVIVGSTYYPNQPSQTTFTYSTDGKNWATTQVAGLYDRIGAGGGKFVALGSGATGVYSTDGVSWETMTMPFSGSWSSITYGNGRFLATASYAASKSDPTTFEETNKCAYSLDGIHWETSVLPETGRWGCASYGNNTFIALLDDSAVIAHSPDATTWDYSFTFKYSINACNVFSKDRFIVLAVNRNTLSTDHGIYSFDGKSWNEFDLPSDSRWEEVVYGNGRFLAFGVGSDEETLVGAFSTDGKVWKPMTLPSLPPDGSIYAAYGNDRVVVVVNYTNTALYWDLSSKN